MPNFETAPVIVNIALLLVSAGAVWFMGIRLARYSKQISERFRLGQTIVGTILLGGVVSLPEMTMAATAAFEKQAQLAVNTLLGGIALAVLTLAITDAAVGPEPLSSDVVRPVVLLQGALVVLLLTIAGAGIVIPDRPLFGAGIWTIAIAVFYVLFLVLIDVYEKSRSWVPEETAESRPNPSEKRPAGQAPSAPPLGRLVVFIAAAAAVVIGAGVTASLVAGALAVQTGLGASFAGFLLGGIVTTLPEISSTIAAVRLKQYEMAYGDAFGTNLFSLMLLFAIDLIYPGGPILREVGRFSQAGILLGIAVTTVCLSGLIARPKRAILRMGVDSILVICISAIGLVLLYAAR